MKVLAFTNLFPNPYQPHRGTFNRQQLGALARLHDVHVVSPVAWTDEFQGRYQRGRMLTSARRESVEGLTVDYPRYYFPPKILRRSYGSCLFRSVRRLMTKVNEQFQPDLIYAAWVYPDGWAAVRLGKQFGVPVVVKAHGSDILELKQTQSRLGGTVAALRGADAVFCVSGDLANHAAEYGVANERIHVVYDGVDCERFFPGDRREARVRLGLPNARNVLFVGNLVPIKGIEMLIEACSLLSARGAPVNCRIIGQGPLRGALQARINACGLNDSVRLVGPIPHNQLADWYRAADLFVLPSYSEGLPCVLIEAAACGIPFVASRVGGIPEIAAVAPSILTPPGDAGQLATAIERVLENPPTSRIAGSPILCSLDETAGRITRLFQDVLDRFATKGNATCPSLPIASELPRR